MAESTVAQRPLRLVEELLLLLLNPQSGYLDMVPGWSFSCLITGAVLADLALENRIDTDQERLFLTDSTPTGDNLLDPTLEVIGKSKEDSDAQFWVETTAGHADEVVTLALDRLAERRILDRDLGGYWRLSQSVSRSGTIATSDTETRQESKQRIIEVIVNESIPDPRDAILIALLHTAGGFKLILEPEEYRDKLDWIETVAKFDLLGRTVANVVENTTAAPKMQSVLQSKPIPKLRIIDLLRTREFFSGNIPWAMAEIYRKHGPVVKMPFKVGGSQLIGLIGPEINKWINKHGRFYLRTKDYIEGLEKAFGASRTMPGMDGAEHYKMRKSVRGAYSQSNLARQLPELIQYCRDSLSTWREGAPFQANGTFMKHTSVQISHLTVGMDCTTYSYGLLKYQKRALQTHVSHAMPKFMLKTPKMRRYRRSMDTLLEEIFAAHTPAMRKGKPKSVPDAFLELHKNDPSFFPETDLAFPIILAMITTIYLSQALGFAVYCMIKHPGIYEKVREEADRVFDNGKVPDGKTFRPAQMDVTRRVYLESQRLYPVVPMQTRTTMNGCIIDGFEIPAQTSLLICQTAPHYMDELYKDPLKFDIDRYLPGRSEHTQQGAYGAYGLGTHVCLGNRWVELNMVVNPAAHCVPFGSGDCTRRLSTQDQSFSDSRPDQEVEVQSRKSQELVLMSRNSYFRLTRHL